jgi:hypothetical protein
MIAPICTSTSPIAAASASAGAIPVSGGTMSPIAPRISSMPIVFTRPIGIVSTHAIMGCSFSRERATFIAPE